MNFTDFPVYSTIIIKIDEYNTTHSSPAKYIIMNSKSNKKLAQELNRSENCISIDRIFHIDIIIRESLYDFEIIVQNKKPKDENVQEMS
jgi:peptide deformylase